jgi:Ca2+/H+ antiporter
MFAAVYYAEVVAQVARRVGEPFGTPVFAFAVTVMVIEVALIVGLLRSACIMCGRQCRGVVTC